MARKPASRSTAAATTTTNLPTNMVSSSNPTHSSNAAYSPSATMTVAGGPAPAEPPSPGVSAPVSSTSATRKRAQPRSKNHGRFPCSIPGCYAVANHLSSMCRHKWGHLPQRLLPACRGHLANGAPCPVRYQGRADTMKRHWITHHTNEGPWVPDRYPPFEDLWKLVRDGEIVLTPPSKYAYDSPHPEDGNTASSFTRAKSGDGTGRRNSVGVSSKLGGLSSVAGGSSRTAGARRNSFSGRAGQSPGGTVRLSRGNNKPWKLSDPVDSSFEVEEDGETDELDVTMDEEYLDVEMEDATRDDHTMVIGRTLATSPSHHSVLYSPAHSHYSRSQRSNSNPLSPDSLRSAAADHDIHIHVPLMAIPPITPRTSSSGESIIAHRFPLLPASNYSAHPTSSVRDHSGNFEGSYGFDKPKNSGGLGLLALSAMQEHRHIYGPENQDPNFQVQGVSINSIKITADASTGQYVYGNKKGSPPGPGYTPASIPHSELSLLSHPPTDRALPSQSSTGTVNESVTLKLPNPPRRNSVDSSPFAYSHASHGIWSAHGQPSLSRPVTVASH